MAAPPAYHVMPIPQPEGASVSGNLGSAINNKGAVVGTLELPGFRYRAFIFQDGIMRDFAAVEGADSFALGINDFGHVVGRAVDADGGRRAFV